MPAPPTSPNRAPRLPAEARREQILDVTKALAARRSFHAVSIDAVAREAGISRPIVYDHFGDLPGLLEALIEREEARALAQLIDVLPAGGTGQDLRETAIEAYRRFLEAAQAEPDTWRLVLMSPQGAPEGLHASITKGREAVVAQLAAFVATGGAGLSPSPDPELTARSFSAMADEGVRLLLTDPERYSPQRLLEHTRWLLSQMPLGPRS